MITQNVSAALTSEDKYILKNNVGTGLNELGKVLMRVRQSLDENLLDNCSKSLTITL